MKKSNIKIIVTFIFTAILWVAGLSPGVFAQETIDPDVSKEYADHGYLVISPNQLRFGTLDSGNSYTEEITAVNIGGRTLSFKLSVEPYFVKDGSYEAIYSQPTNRTKVADWVSFLDGTDFTLDPQEKTNIRIRVKVPDDASSGGQYAAVMATLTSNASDPSSPINAVSRIALPLYSAINGVDLKYSGAIISHNIPVFSLKSTIRSTSTIENTGNADFEATYDFFVKNFFSDDLAYEKSEKKIILPETTYISSQAWDGAPALGIFKVTQNITFINSEGKQTVNSYDRVTIICPLWFFVAILIVLAAIIAAIIIHQTKRRKIRHLPK